MSTPPPSQQQRYLCLSLSLSLSESRCERYRGLRLRLLLRLRSRPYLQLSKGVSACTALLCCTPAALHALRGSLIAARLRVTQPWLAAAAQHTPKPPQSPRKGSAIPFTTLGNHAPEYHPESGMEARLFTAADLSAAGRRSATPTYLAPATTLPPLPRPAAAVRGSSTAPPVVHRTARAPPPPTCPSCRTAYPNPCRCCARRCTPVAPWPAAPPSPSPPEQHRFGGT